MDKALIKPLANLIQYTGDTFGVGALLAMVYTVWISLIFVFVLRYMHKIYKSEIERAANARDKLQDFLFRELYGERRRSSKQKGKRKK